MIRCAAYSRGRGGDATFHALGADIAADLRGAEALMDEAGRLFRGRLVLLNLEYRHRAATSGGFLEGGS